MKWATFLIFTWLPQYRKTDLRGCSDFQQSVSISCKRRFQLRPTLNDVIKTTIFLSDFANYKGMNVVYNEFFEAAPPARSTVRCDLVLPTLLIEVEAIAVVD